MKTQRMAWTAMSVALIGTAAVAGKVAVPVDMKQIRQVEVDYVYRIDANGKRIGPNIYPNPIMSAVREAPSWQIAFDNTKWNLTTNAVGTNVYGTPAPFRYWSIGTGFYNSPNIINDVSIAPSSQGRLGTRFMALTVWNPGGGVTPTPTGVGTQVIQIFGLSSYSTTEEEGPAGIITGGVALVLENRAGGFIATSLDTSNFNFGIPLPYGDAGVWARIGTFDSGGNFVQLPAGNAQFLNSPFQDAADPGYPGTNPSSSDRFQWEDVTTGPGTANTPDGVFQTLLSTASLPTPYSEYVDNDVPITGVTFRFQATLGVAYDDNLPVALGKVSFSDLSFTVAATPVTVVPVDASGTVITGPGGASLAEELLLPIRESDGRVTVPSLTLVDALGEPITTRFKITSKPRGILRKTTEIWDTTAGAFVFDWEMKSGDIDNDNSITVFDYDKLSAFFDKTSADSDWETADADGVAPIDADIDGDGQVTVFDYDILSTNFDLVGDDAP